MTVPSLVFILFACLAAALIHVRETAAWRSGVMLFANLAFLASFSHDPRMLAPFAAFLAIGYAAVRLLQAGRRGLLPALIVLTLVLFFWLKKYAFIPPQFWLSKPYLVVGLSYVFFRVLHLVIDAGQGALEERLTPIDYVNYTLNFPCIVAGPIQMYPDWKAGQEGRPDLDTIGWSAERIITGLFKVMFISALLNDVQTQARASLLIGGDDRRAILDGVQVIAVYPIYLYFNFSGYTDVVVGAGRLMGLRLPENFNRPFSAANFIDFWSRWHITLSTWLRTYVYSPLMMSLMRRFPAPELMPAITVACFFVTFFLVGAWHGQTAEFLLFGVLQGGGVAINKLYQLQMAKVLGRKGYRKLSDNPVYIAFSRGLTFTWFAFTLLWFWGRGRELNQYAMALSPAQLAATLAVIWLAATVILEGVDRTLRLSQGFYRLNQRALCLGAMILLLTIYLSVLNSPAPPVVYKAF